MGRRSNDRSRGTNTRASERIAVEIPAAVKWGTSQNSGIIELVNVGGLYVATARCPEIGDYVDLLFSLPGDRRAFRVRGTVVFSDAQPEMSSQSPGFGARFERPPVALVQAIKALQKKDH